MYILLIAAFITLTTTARQNKPRNINNAAPQMVPATISKWISTALGKGKNKKLLNDYTSDRFFSADSSRIMGYIKGYNTALKFTSGIIYMTNDITREDYPTVVPVYPDGRFEVDVKMIHPQCLSIYLPYQSRRLSLFKATV